MRHEPIAVFLRAFMDAMVLAVVADTVSNCRQTLLLRLHTIDIAMHRYHFVVLDFVADRTDALDIVRSDIVIATIEHRLDWHMDLPSDNCRMQLKKLLAVVVHNMVVDMEAMQLLAMLVPQAVSVDTNLNGRLHGRLFQSLNLFLPVPMNRFFRSHDLVYRWFDLIAVDTWMQVPHMMINYFELVPWMIATNVCCAIVHFGCTLVSIAMMMLMHLPVCGRQTLSRYVVWPMSCYCKWMHCCHCMQSADWIRMRQAKTVELHLAVPMRMQSILISEKMIID